MNEMIHHFTTVVHDSEGRTYEASAYGKQRSDETWEGWLEFHPSESDAPVLKTERETTQASREALLYWATGLEPVFLEGALQRAWERSQALATSPD